MFREYACGIPSFSPDKFVTIGDHCDSYGHLVVPRSSTTVESAQKFYYPYRNPSIFRLMHWYHSVSNLKSLGELNRLVRDVLLAEDFNISDLEQFSAEREAARLNLHHDSSSHIFATEDGWREGTVTIPVPIERSARSVLVTEATSPRFQVCGLFYRSITQFIKAALQENNATRYHLTPFKEYWKPSADALVERLYSEITSNVMIEALQAVQNQILDYQLEKIVIPILLWSDSTHLTSSGNASIWPIYLFIGNLSKYVRNKPSSLSYHIYT